MSEPTKLPDDVERAITYLALDRSDLAQAVDSYITHQRAATEKMADRVRHHDPCRVCAYFNGSFLDNDKRCAAISKNTMACVDGILAHFEAQVKGEQT